MQQVWLISPREREELTMVDDTTLAMVVLLGAEAVRLNTAS
jgi:hypothetical protein